MSSMLVDFGRLAAVTLAGRPLGRAFCETMPGYSELRYRLRGVLSPRNYTLVTRRRIRLAGTPLMQELIEPRNRTPLGPL
jgi:hypothetical protein